MNKNLRIDSDGMNSTQINAQHCRLVAFDTHLTADLLLDGYRGKGVSVVPSAIVLRAFSVELIIKSGLIAAETKTPRMHNLHSLFELLDNTVKMSASAKYLELRGKDKEEDKGKDLVDLLRSQKDAFIDWRYLFEVKEREISCNPEELRDAFLAIYAGVACKFQELMRIHPLIS
jgi:hypothetical protein